MTRKKFSNDNRLTVQLTDNEYKKVFNLSDKIGCSKVDVIRYLLSGRASGLNQHDLNVLKQNDNKVTDALNRYYLNLWRIGGNLHQAVHNQDIAIKSGRDYGPINSNNLRQLWQAMKYINKLVHQDLKNRGVI